MTEVIRSLGCFTDYRAGGLFYSARRILKGFFFMITFKGKHLSELGIEAAVKSKKRPLLPEVKDYTYDIPYSDGSLDLSEQNPMGRRFYKDRIFSLIICVKASCMNELSENVSKLCSFMTGNGELIFDDMPNVKWDARVIEEMSFEPKYYGHEAEVEVNFLCRPFSRYFMNTAEDVLLGSDIRIGSDVPLGAWRGIYTYEMNGGTSDRDGIKITNYGTAPVSPIIRINIDGTLDKPGVSLRVRKGSIEGKVIFWTNRFDVSKEIIIDFENHKIFADGQNITGKIRWDMGTGECLYELLPGENRLYISINDGYSGTGTITAEFEPRFLYNADGLY